MAYRKRMSRRGSKRNFKHGARRINKKNFKTGSARGGIRL